MPHYYAAGINIRLSTLRSPSLTATPTGHMGDEFAKEVRRIESAISNGKVLKEDLMCLSESTPEEDINDPLEFLGKDQRVPFFCVGVKLPELENMIEQQNSPDLSELSAEQHNRSPALSGSNKIDSSLLDDEMHLDTSSSLSSLLSTPSLSPAIYGSLTQIQAIPSQMEGVKKGPLRSVRPLKNSMLASLDPRICLENAPVPLALTVELDKTRSFARGSKTGMPEDIKIDVFFNGQHTHCTLVSRRIVKDNKPATYHFSGMRIARLVEAAWLAFPSSPTSETVQAAYSGESTPATHFAAEKRWEELSRSIAIQADSLGLNKNKCRPPLGEYLETLSNLEMPSAVGTYHTSNTRTFGVIDVVITLGSGRKYSPSHGFLKRPAKMLDPSFGADSPKDSNMEFEDALLSGDSQVKEQNEVLENANQVVNTFASKEPAFGALEQSRFNANAFADRILDSDITPFPRRAISVVIPSPLKQRSIADKATPRPTQTSTGPSTVDPNLTPEPWLVTLLKNASILEQPKRALKKRKTSLRMGIVSKPLSNLALQRLARHPNRESNITNLGPPKIYFPDLPNNDLDPTRNLTSKKAASTKKKSKSLIVKLKTPIKDYFTRSQSKSSEPVAKNSSKPMKITIKNPAFQKQSAKETNKSNPSKLRYKRKLDDTLHPATATNLIEFSELEEAETSDMKDQSELGPTPQTRKSPVSSITSNASLLPRLKRKKAQDLTLNLVPNVESLSAIGWEQSLSASKQNHKSMEPTHGKLSFSVPDLSRCSVLSYLPPSGPVSEKLEIKNSGSTEHTCLAEPNCDLNNQQLQNNAFETGALRQIRSERGGEFAESEVLFGCRFVVGV